MLEPTGPGSREFLPAALLPGAERNFAAAEVEGSPCSVVDGVRVGWSEDKTKRLAHLQKRVPTAVVISLVDLIRSKEAMLIEKLAGNCPVVVTSFGIDNAGERDTIDPPAGNTFKLERRCAATDLVLHMSPDLPVDLIG